MTNNNPASDRSTRVPQPLLVRGILQLPEGFSLLGAQARVRLLDTTYADAPSTVLVEQIIAILDNSEPIEFELRGEVPPPNGSYTVSAHVKANPDPARGEKYDEIEPGDYLTTQSYPVNLSADAPAEVTLEVNRYAGPAEPLAGAAESPSESQPAELDIVLIFLPGGPREPLAPATADVKEGTILVAHPDMRGDLFFGDAVILVLAHGDRGTMGVNIASAPIKDRICLGGPMEGALLLLHKAGEPSEYTTPVGDTGYAVTSLGIDEAGNLQPADFLERNAEGSLQLYGYAGWAASQLSFEMAAGAWRPTTASLESLLAAPPEQRWELALKGVKVEE